MNILAQKKDNANVILTTKVFAVLLLGGLVFNLIAVAFAWYVLVPLALTVCPS